MPELFIRTPFSECPDEFRGDIHFGDEPSLTKQCFAAECDFNNIMERYVRTGTLPENVRGPGIYADVADLPSYQEAQQLIINARNAFYSLGSNVRDYFMNDPARFLDFMSNLDANKDMAIKLGLLNAPAERPQEAGVAGALPPQEAK